jgi:membrane protease subunit HflK
MPVGIDEVFFVKTKRVLQEEFGFRTKSTANRRIEYSRKSFDHESLMLTGDLNVAEVEWVVQYQISDPFKYIFQTSNPTINVRDVSESIMRRVVGDRSVTEVLTTGRVEIAIEAQKLMQGVLDRYDMGIKIVNEVNEAKQEQEKVINQAEQAYNKVIPEAKGKAEKMISEAEGYAAGLVNESEGDAAKFTAILKEYKRAPLITRKRIYIETMEKIFRKMENLTIVDSKIKGLLPIFGKDEVASKVVK